MRNKVRILALICAGIMLLGLAACTKTDDSGNTTPADTNPAATPETTDELYLGYPKDKIPESLNYNNDKVKILYWSDAERKEFETTDTDDDSDRIISAIKARNEVVQQRLGVTFEWEGVEGSFRNRNKFTQHVEAQYKSSNYYDVIATYSRTAGSLSTSGYLMDINTVENNYLDFDESWWPDTLIDTCTIGKSLYFVSGDISTNTLHFMYGVYYNKNLLSQHQQLEDPTLLVQSKKWTIAKLIEMSSNMYQDDNANGQKDKDDSYGFCTINFHCDAFYTGSDLMLVEEDPDKVLVISPDFTGEKAINLVDTLGQWLTSDTCYTNSADYVRPFASGKTLFCLDRAYRVDPANDSGLNAVDWKYGILPTPMYDENQSDYITVIGNPFTLYGIGNGCADPSRATAVLECWASEAYRRTTPAIFEVNMKLRYAKDNVDAQMYDILRRTGRYDLGRIYATPLQEMSEMPSRAACEGQSWASISQSKAKGLKISLEKIVNDLETKANLVK